MVEYEKIISKKVEILMNKTKKAIFESAIKVFSNYGYTGATMDEVVARVAYIITLKVKKNSLFL